MWGMQKLRIARVALYSSRRGISNEPRNVAMYLLRTLWGDNLEEIGRDYWELTKETFNILKYLGIPFVKWTDFCRNAWASFDMESIITVKDRIAISLNYGFIWEKSLSLRWLKNLFFLTFKLFKRFMNTYCSVFYLQPRGSIWINPSKRASPAPDGILKVLLGV